MLLLQFSRGTQSVGRAITTHSGALQTVFFLGQTVFLSAADAHGNYQHGPADDISFTVSAADGSQHPPRA